MGLFGNFHDSCVREVHVVTGHFVEEDLTMRVDWRTTIHMLIQRQFRNPCAIELRFEEVVGLRMVPPSARLRNHHLSRSVLCARWCLLLGRGRKLDT